MAATFPAFFSGAQLPSFHLEPILEQDTRTDEREQGMGIQPTPVNCLKTLSITRLTCSVVPFSLGTMTQSCTGKAGISIR